MSKKAVFIIESVFKKHENNDNYYEGRILKQMLYLSSIESDYVIIKNRKDLHEALKRFRLLNYRYLHIACHGSRDLLRLQDAKINHLELASILRPFVSNKRIFISACKVVNRNLAVHLFKGKNDCYSVIGPGKSVYMDDSASCYLMFYVIALKNPKILRATIIKKFSSICGMLKIKLNYFSKSKSSANHFSYKLLR